MKSIEKHSHGKYKVRVTWTDAAGKRHDTERLVDANTIGQARVEREKLRQQLSGTGGEWTVAEAVDAWLPTLRAGTRRVRRAQTKAFAAKFGKLRLSTVKPAEAQRMLAGLLVSDTTAGNYRDAWLALYKFARAQGRLLGDNPIEATTRRVTPRTSAEWVDELEGDAPKRALVGDEIGAFFEALLEQEPALYPMARCQFLLGCRWSEVAALQWRDIDWHTGVVTIRRAQDAAGELGPPKGKKKRTTALGREGLAFMRGHRAAMERAGWQGYDVWAFPRPETGRVRRHDMWPYSTAAKRVRRLMRSLGLGMACSTHAMRHSHVTLARQLESEAANRAATGQALRDAVGHSDERLTERYTDESHRKAVAQDFASKLESKLGDVVEIRKGRK